MTDEQNDEKALMEQHAKMLGELIMDVAAASYLSVAALLNAISGVVETGCAEGEKRQ